MGFVSKQTLFIPSLGRYEYRTDRKLVCCEDALIGEALLLFTLRKDERRFLEAAHPCSRAIFALSTYVISPKWAASL
jgi:hypothetical protein